MSATRGEWIEWTVAWQTWAQVWTRLSLVGKYKFTSSVDQLYIVAETSIFWITGMIFRYPLLASEDSQVLEMIRQLRRDLRHQVNVNPVRWTGFLRRNTFARALQGSNSIEGINADLAEAV
ncbi:MAG: hypothetical protein IT536_14445, partial [Hyphomicrobiales bacterium]|nr:hypothetical protein [Hyphomicrobiales bacterium]